MKALYILAGVGLLLLGAVVTLAGLNFSGPGGQYSPVFAGAFAQSLAGGMVRDLGGLFPRTLLEAGLFSQSGYLFLLGGPGVVIFLCGLLVFRNLPKTTERAVIRRDESAARDLAKARAAQAESAAAAAKESGSGKKSPLSFSAKKTEAESGMFAGLDETEKTNAMINLAHAAMDAEKCREVLKEFRPKLLPFAELCREEALTAIAKQTLDMEILRRRRQQADISPDQFRSFDFKITKLERDAICHRYLPRDPDAAPAEAREHFGMVYDRHSYSAVQQKLQSEADDWKEISLRNAEEVLALATPAATTGGGS